MSQKAKKAKHINVLLGEERETGGPTHPPGNNEKVDPVTYCKERGQSVGETVPGPKAKGTRQVKLSGIRSIFAPNLCTP